MIEPSMEYLELKSLILELKATIDLLLPQGDVSLSYIANQVGRSRNAIRSYLHNHYEPEVDYYRKGGKIYMSKATAVDIIRRYK